MKGYLIYLIISLVLTITMTIGPAYWPDLKNLKLAFERRHVLAEYRMKRRLQDYTAAELTLLNALHGEAHADPLGQSKLHSRLGELHRVYMGNESTAERYYLAALADISEGKSPEAMKQNASVFRQLGVLEDNRGKPSEALKYFQASLEAVQALRLPEDEANLYQSIGIVHTNLKDFGRAEFYLEEARRRIEAAIPADLGRVALIHNNLASLFQQSGQPDRALPYAMKAVEIADLSDDEWLKPSAYDTLASVYSDLGQNEQALMFIEKALILDAVSELRAANLQLTYGTVLSRLDRKEEACASWKNSAEQYEKAENKKEQEVVRQELAANGC